MAVTPCTLEGLKSLLRDEKKRLDHDHADSNEKAPEILDPSCAAPAPPTPVMRIQIKICMLWAI